MGLRNTAKRWGFSLLAQDSPIVTQNSLSWFFVPGNLDGDSVPHSHGTHKILDFGYLAPHKCVRSRTPMAYRELLCNYKNAGGSHYGTTKKGRKHQTHKQCKGSIQQHWIWTGDRISKRCRLSHLHFCAQASSIWKSDCQLQHRCRYWWNSEVDCSGRWHRE